jgi:dienelactone hydrolase
MVDELRWGGQAIADDGVMERPFEVARPSGAVPGLMWMPPASQTPPPLILLGHGGSGHKRSARITDLAHWFALNAGAASVAIDGPYHGDRMPVPLQADDYQARIAAEGVNVVLDRMTSDWTSTVHSIGASLLVDTGRLSYVGMSMGTRFGLSVTAEFGDHMTCVVLGKFGLTSPSINPGLATPRRIEADAARITAPLLFHMQRDDELFPRQGQLDLFNALGSQDKQLIAFSGMHADTAPTAVATWRQFVSERLRSD